MQFRRIESPSSINTFKQCPRKYFYHYIKNIETTPNIHLVRGKIAHSVLEDFFRIDISGVSIENFDFELKIILHDLLGQQWRSSADKLSSLGMKNHEICFYLDETKQMLQFWLLDFIKLMKMQLQTKNLREAFESLRPETEIYLRSEKHGVHGYIDAVHKNGGLVKIIDYKTSRRDHINEAYKLQLAIYALLYQEKYKRIPDEVGIHFLKFCEKTLPVSQSLINFAAAECKSMHENTISDDIKNYTKNKSPLCRWSTGECDFYKICKS